MTRQLKQALPVIDDCSGCGECCRHIGTPPGYAALAVGKPKNAWPTDKARWSRIPAEIRASLEGYYAELVAAGWPRELDRSEQRVACLWFDESTSQCRHHKWRPQVCRDFEVGGADCRAWRDGVAAE